MASEDQEIRVQRPEAASPINHEISTTTHELRTNLSAKRYGLALVKNLIEGMTMGLSFQDIVDSHVLVYGMPLNQGIKLSTGVGFGSAAALMGACIVMRSLIELSPDPRLKRKLEIALKSINTTNNYLINYNFILILSSFVYSCAFYGVGFTKAPISVVGWIAINIIAALLAGVTTNEFRLAIEYMVEACKAARHPDYQRLPVEQALAPSSIKKLASVIGGFFKGASLGQNYALSAFEYVNLIGDTAKKAKLINKVPSRIAVGAISGASALVTMLLRGLSVFGVTAKMTALPRRIKKFLSYDGSAQIETDPFKGNSWNIGMAFGALSMALIAQFWALLLTLEAEDPDRKAQAREQLQFVGYSLLIHVGLIMMITLGMDCVFVKQKKVGTGFIRELPRDEGEILRDSRQPEEHDERIPKETNRQTYTSLISKMDDEEPVRENKDNNYEGESDKAISPIIEISTQTELLASPLRQRIKEGGKRPHFVEEVTAQKIAEADRSDKTAENIKKNQINYT